MSQEQAPRQYVNVEFECRRTLRISGDFDTALTDPEAIRREAAELINCQMPYWTVEQLMGMQHRIRVIT